MPLPEYLIAREGDACTCGRIKSRLHCPACGSFKLRFMPSMSRDALHPKGSLDSTSYVKKFFRCDICAYTFEESEREHCEAPLYETKAQKAAAELVRAKRARESNEPLTRKEETLIRQLDRSPGLSNDVDKILEQEQVNNAQPEEIRKLRIEWANLRVAGQTIQTVEEFVEQKLREKRQQHA